MRAGVYLELLDWSVSVGGEHITATLSNHCDGKYVRHDLQHALTQAEADRLNAKDRLPGYACLAKYKAGDLSQRFFTAADVVAAARKQWRKLFPHAAVLIRGSSSVADPQECLSGPLWFKTACNRMWRAFNACGGYEGNEGAATAYSNAYTLLEKALESSLTQTPPR